MLALTCEKDQDGGQETQKRERREVFEEDSVVPGGRCEATEEETREDSGCERNAEEDCYTGGDG